MEDFTYKGIETTEYDDDPPFYGFQSVKKNLVMSGDIRTADKLFKLNFFLANHEKSGKKLAKGQARKILCEYIAMLLRKKMIKNDYRFYLEADPNYGAGLRDEKRKTTMKGLTDMYRTMTFKVVGKERFGNIPMETTIGDFMKWCKDKDKKPVEKKKKVIKVKPLTEAQKKWIAEFGPRK